MFPEEGVGALFNEGLVELTSGQEEEILDDSQLTHQLAAPHHEVAHVFVHCTPESLDLVVDFFCVKVWLVGEFAKSFLEVVEIGCGNESASKTSRALL